MNEIAKKTKFLEASPGNNSSKRLIAISFLATSIFLGIAACVYSQFFDLRHTTFIKAIVEFFGGASVAVVLGIAAESVFNKRKGGEQ